MNRVFCLAGVLVFALVGCHKQSARELLSECNAAAQVGDEKSWNQVRDKLGGLLADGQVRRDTEGADRVHCLYVESLIHTGRAPEALAAAKHAVELFPGSS